jgi:hypothetical protein
MSGVLGQFETRELSHEVILRWQHVSDAGNALPHYSEISGTLGLWADRRRSEECVVKFFITHSHLTAVLDRTS